MNYNTVIWIICISIIVVYSIFNKVKYGKTPRRILFGVFLAALIGPILLPNSCFGKWDAVPKLKNEKIVEIILQPYDPNWPVNLVGKDSSITEKIIIDSLITMLQHSKLYFPNHPMRVWDANVLLISSEKDSMEIKVEQSVNGGVIVTTGANSWNNNFVGTLLERITRFKNPVYADSATQRLAY